MTSIGYQSKNDKHSEQCKPLPGPDEGLQNIKPLTEDDCDEFYIKMNKNAENVEKFEKLCRKFVSQIRDMLKIIESKCLTDKEKTRISQLNQLSRLAPDKEIFIRCYQKIWAMRTAIATKNASWIQSQDYKHLVKKDAKQDMIIGIISLVQDTWKSLSPAETEKYWKVMQELLRETANFVKLLK